MNFAVLFEQISMNKMKQIKQVVNLLLPVSMIVACLSDTQAQTNYRFGTNSGPAGGASGTGYTVANQKVTFVNSATPAVFGTTNVIVSLSNQQYGNATSKPFEGMTNPIYSGGIAFGASGGGNDTVPAPFPRFGNLNTFGSPANGNFTINKLAASGTGINTVTTGALTLSPFTDALIDNAGSNIYGSGNLNTELHFADITLTFNEPVSNPVIHLGGLGGTTDGPAIGGNFGFLGYATVFELLDTYTVNRLSGSAKFDVNPATKKATDTASFISFNTTTSQCFGGRTAYGASGSFVVNGVNITSLTFRIYLKGDGGTINSLSTPGCPSTTGLAVTATNYPVWATTALTRGDGFTLSVSFARLKIMGNVFNDPDGGNINSSTGVANLIPGGIYANLIDTATGLVIKSVAVGTNGAYDFGEHNANGYEVVLSSSLGTAGFAPPSFIPPTGWVSTGAYNGTPNTGNTGNTNGISEAFEVTEAGNTININFGIQQLPESDNHNTTIPQPNSNDTLVLNGIGSNPPLLSGSDVQDGTYTGAAGQVRNPSGVIITSLPAQGLLYYDGNPVAAGDTITNPALLNIVLTGTGYTEVEFEYAYLDAAEFADPTPAVYTISWSSALPVTLISFNAATKGDGKVLLEWATASEQNNKGFGIERSVNGHNWINIDFVSSLSNDGNSTGRLDYNSIDKTPLNGMNYYRLKQTSWDGNVAYSPVSALRFSAPNAINIYPNPMKDNLSVSGLEGNEQIKIYNTSGSLVYHQVAGNRNKNISLAHLSEGLYYLQVIGIDGNALSFRLMKIK